MEVYSKTEKAEDEILNTLNGILSHSYNTSEYQNIYKEVKKLVKALEVRGIINPRSIKQNNSGTTP